VRKLLFAIACLSIAVPGVRAQEIINPNNTVVRFAFFNDGTNFGSIDVELFDQDKPQTVRNFLLYVYSGGYSNIFLQRVVPNFVVQGGRGRIPDPTSTNKFTNYIATPTYGRITNEFNVGPVHSNEFGTLAMGRITGLTNSAEAEWYFNLTNTPFLDVSDGGFTVFGHVVNTIGDRSGTNLLNYFSGFPRGHGITNVVTESPLDPLSELPVATNRSPAVQYRDLFTMEVYVIQNVVPHPDDNSAPVVTALIPATTNIVVTNATFRMSGTASDNTEVARVYYVSDIFGRYAADGTTDWSAEVRLYGGVNRFTIYSVDWRGNVSTPVERVIYRDFSLPIDLRVSGRGKVTGLTTGQVLKVGEIYTIKAKPNYDWVFIGWSVSFGDGNDQFYIENPLQFYMAENMVITANFAQPICVGARGAYSGVFSPGTNGPSRSAGLISFNMAPNGSYSGRLAPLGAGYQIRGRFGFDGRTVISGKLGSDTLVLDMYLLTNGFNRIIGTYSDGHFVSSVALFPVEKFNAKNPSPRQGNYSFLLSPSLDINAPVSGYGSGTVTINSLGRAKISGTLADGATFTRTTRLCRGDLWPFSGAARRGGGSLVGWALFDTNGITFDGDVKWFSPNLPGNTNQNVILHGSHYDSPTQMRLLNWTNGVVTLSGGGLNGALAANVMLNEDGSFTILSNPNNIQLNVVESSGILTGTFVYPGTLAVTPIKGAVLQSSNIVAGFFQGSSGRGSILIRGE